MCRWLGYIGHPIRLDELLYRIDHSLIEQSLSAKHMATPTNGDGFGIGWYGTAERPGVYRNTSPAWSDRNLRELAEQIRSPLFLAHLRASTGTPVQQTNCHPFRHGRWLFCHNGFIGEFEKVRRELLLAVDPDLFLTIEGTTDSELFFHLALTLGLEDDPLGAFERAAGLVEETGREHGIEMPLQMTVGLSDGESLYGIRYASGPEVNTLFLSADIATLRELYPDDARLVDAPDHARAIVSEPVGTALPGTWAEITPGVAVIVGPDGESQVPFRPVAPAALHRG